MDTESTPVAEDTSTANLDADAVNESLVGTDIETDTETPHTDSSPEEHPGTPDTDDAQTSVTTTEEAETTEERPQAIKPPVDASVKAKKEADATITRLGQRLAEQERVNQEIERRYLQRDATRIMGDPYEFGRMLQNAKSQEDFAYIAKVKAMLPGPHKNAAEAQEQAWKAERLANETPEERAARLEREIEDRITQKVEAKYAPFVERQMQQARAENEKVIDDFLAKHQISREEFKGELEQKMLPFYVTARDTFPDLDDSALLERALVAVDPERVRRAGKAEALLNESDRRAAAMVNGSQGGASPQKDNESDEARAVREKMESAWSTRSKHFKIK